MKIKKPPVSIILLASVYILVGVAGFVYHFHIKELIGMQRDTYLIEFTELVAFVAGVFMLRGQNWARWLALLWMGFHVAISAFDEMSKLAVHALFFVVIAWVLFRREAREYFRGTSDTT